MRTALEFASEFSPPHYSIRQYPMWPFFLDRSITLNKRIRGNISQVQEIFLNVDSFVRLNPYVIKVEQDPANTQRYKITDRLPGPFHLWEYENSIHAIFTPKEDERGQGVDVVVSLPQTFLFPKLENRYRVKGTDQPGILEITEVVELRVSISGHLRSRSSDNPTCIPSRRRFFW